MTNYKFYPVLGFEKLDRQYDTSDEEFELLG